MSKTIVSFKVKQLGGVTLAPKDHLGVPLRIRHVQVEFYVIDERAKGS
jgi:hypothetical protein